MSETLDLVRDRAALKRSLGSFEFDVWLTRRKLFLRHVELNVRAASPLLTVLEQTEGIDSRELAARFEPPPSWPARPLPGSRFLSVEPVGAKGRGGFSRERLLRRHRFAGAILPLGGSRENLIALRLAGEAVEVTAGREGVRLETCGGLCRLLLAHPIPETAVAQLAGRAVQDLVDHRWLRGPPWPILDVQVAGGRQTIVTFFTGQDDWTLSGPNWSVCA